MAVLVSGRNIALDARDRFADTNFVSHAHSDHTGGVVKGKEVISSDVTMELIRLRKGISPRRIPGLEGAKLLNAGHILGSKQLLAQSDDGYSFLYSGDYQLQKSPVAESIEVENSDVLIIDSTFPYADVEFDDKNEVITAIQHYLDAKLRKGIVLFGAYALGKAQELVRIANEAGITPLVSEKISGINEVYVRNGARLEYLSAQAGADEFSTGQKGNFMGIVETSRMREVAQALAEKSQARVFTAVATGFAKMFRMNVNVQFPLSDHADFKQATEYIDQCSPKLIYTYGSRENQKLFAENLSNEGYNAHPFFENVGREGLDVKARLLHYVQM